MADTLVRGALRIAFETSGRGPGLVLLHGAEASRRMFDWLVPLLASQFTVIAFDQRDCGETEGSVRAATLEDLADDVRDLVDSLGLARVHVFGSSFGGRVAQAFALRHAEALDRLVLGSTWPLPDSLEQLNPQGTATLQALRDRLPQSAGELASLFFPEDFLVQRPDLRQFFAQVRPATARSVRGAQAVGSSMAAKPSDIAAPTLLLAGALDRVVPPDITLAMAGQIRGSAQAVLAGVGHATALQAPGEVAAHLVKFLRREMP